MLVVPQVLVLVLVVVGLVWVEVLATLQAVLEVVVVVAVAAAEVVALEPDAHFGTRDVPPQEEYVAPRPQPQ